MACLYSLLYFYLLTSADNLCKQFGPRAGLTKCRSWSGFELFDTMIVLLKEFFEKVHFEKNSADDKKKVMKKYPACRVNLHFYLVFELILSFHGLFVLIVI